MNGKEIYSDTLESTSMLEKEKFPQDYFPEVGGSPRGAELSPSRPRSGWGALPAAQEQGVQGQVEEPASPDRRVQ